MGESRRLASIPSGEVRVYDGRVGPALCHVFLPGSTAPTMIHGDGVTVGALRQGRRFWNIARRLCCEGVANAMGPIQRVPTGNGSHVLITQFVLSAAMRGCIIVTLDRASPSLAIRGDKVHRYRTPVRPPPTTHRPKCSFRALRRSRRFLTHLPGGFAVNALTSACTQFVPSGDARVYAYRVGPRFSNTTRFDSPNDTSASSRLGRYGRAAG